MCCHWENKLEIGKPFYEVENIAFFALMVPPVYGGRKELYFSQGQRPPRGQE